MAEARYRPGDVIVVRSGISKSAQAQGIGEVIAVLPETRGVVSYRVRFQHENFERHVSHEEIDNMPSERERERIQISAESRSSSWIDSSKIRVRK